MHAVAPNAPPGPRFLQALDHAEHCGDGTHVAECPICRNLLLITPDEGQWQLECDGECTHNELVAWLAITDLRTHDHHADGDRMWMTMMLATTPDTWQALRRGDPVDQAALDQTWLARFRKLDAI